MSETRTIVKPIRFEKVYTTGEVRYKDQENLLEFGKPLNVNAYDKLTNRGIGRLSIDTDYLRVDVTLKKNPFKCEGRNTTSKKLASYIVKKYLPTLM